MATIQSSVAVLYIRRVCIIVYRKYYLIVSTGVHAYGYCTRNILDVWPLELKSHKNICNVKIARIGQGKAPKSNNIVSVEKHAVFKDGSSNRQFLTTTTTARGGQ